MVQNTTSVMLSILVHNFIFFSFLSLSLSIGLPQVDAVDESLLTQLAYNARGDVCPMQGVIGGITAQEVMKVHLIENTLYLLLIGLP